MRCFFFFFLSPIPSTLATQPQARITFPLSIIGTRPPLSSRESPQGQLIMDLTAAHYPDKAGAVAGQWLPDWLDDSHAVLTGRHRRHSSGSYLMDPADRSSCSGLLLRREWKGSEIGRHRATQWYLRFWLSAIKHCEYDFSYAVKRKWHIKHMNCTHCWHFLSLFPWTVIRFLSGLRPNVLVVS